VAKTPENKENHFISTTWAEEGNFNLFSLTSNIKIMEKKNQIGAKVRSKWRFIDYPILIFCLSASNIINQIIK